MIRFINPGIQPPIYLDTANQRVGIGTASPGHALEVKSPSTNVTIIKVTASDGSSLFEIAESGGGNGNVSIKNAAGTTEWLFNAGSPSSASAQNGLIIGGSGGSISSVALLQLDSTTKGFLPPRMTTTQKNAISSPPAGLVVYDSTLNKLCVYTGAAWETVTSV